MIKVLVLGAGGAAGINFCRSLRQAGGFYTIAADVDRRKVELPDADEYCVMPRIDAAETRKPMIDAFKPDVVYAQADKEVAWLSRYRDQFHTLLPSQKALDIASDKLFLNKHLENSGVPVPVSAGWATSLDENAYYNIWRGGKAWVRARCGAGSKAALPVNSYKQGEHWVQYWSEFRGLSPDQFMVSEFLPGTEYAWQGVYRGGLLYASVARTRDEYVFAEQMPSGQSSTPSVATIVHSDQVNRLAEMAVNAIDPVPNGVYGVDCKTDAAGVAKVTEINVGRFYTTSNFYAAAGYNLPALWATLANGHNMGTIGWPVRNPIPAGMTWIRSLDREPLLIQPQPATLELQTA